MTVSRQALTLSGDEEKLFECLDKFVQHVRTAEPSHATLEARIAGGWVRDKVRSVLSRAVAC
jgi:tRNA nucleotidyltransferase/poly(A) polymerase